jgi:hypothetical protein
MFCTANSHGPAFVRFFLGLIFLNDYIAFIRGVSNTKKEDLKAGLPVKENKILTLTRGQKAPLRTDLQEKYQPRLASTSLLHLMRP